MVKKYFVENLESYQLGKEGVTCQFYVDVKDYPLQHEHADYWEFLIMLDGSTKNYVNRTCRICPAGTLTYCTTKDFHYVTSDKKTPIRYVNFTISEEAVLQILSPFSKDILDKIYRNERSFSLPSEMLNEIEKTLHRLNLLPHKQYIPANDLLLAQIVSLLQFIVKHLQSDKKTEEPVWLQSLRKMEKEEWFLTCKVDDLCQKLNYSRTQLNRLFQENFGKTPHAYLLSYKLLYARNLLNNTNFSTANIADTIGYSSLAQFNTVFKNKFGVTPGQYRK